MFVAQTRCDITDAHDSMLGSRLKCASVQRCARGQVLISSKMETDMVCRAVHVILHYTVCLCAVSVPDQTRPDRTGPDLTASDRMPAFVN